MKPPKDQSEEGIKSSRVETENDQMNSDELPKKKISIARYMATKRAQAMGQLRKNLESLQELQKQAKHPKI